MLGFSLQPLQSVSVHKKQQNTRNGTEWEEREVSEALHPSEQFGIEIISVESTEENFTLIFVGLSASLEAEGGDIWEFDMQMALFLTKSLNFDILFGVSDINWLNLVKSLPSLLAM